MTPQAFAESFYKEKRYMGDLYLDSDEQTEVGTLIRSLNLDSQGHERMRQIIHAVLTDAFYTTLLGIDGASSIGGNQEIYSLLDENGKEVTSGEIESEAWEYFHNYKYEAENGGSDFIAELHYEAVFGRTAPATSGYRPHIKFEFDEAITSGDQRFIGQNFVFPGDTVVAEIRIIAAGHFRNRLNEGTKFEFFEGLRKIGDGKIIKIVNENSKKRPADNTAYTPTPANRQARRVGQRCKSWRTPQNQRFERSATSKAMICYGTVPLWSSSKRMTESR